MVRLLTGSALFLAACTGPTTETGDTAGYTYDAYEPFDPANMSSQLLRLESQDTIGDLKGQATLANKVETFEAIEDEYQANSLSEKVAGRVDVHLDEDGYGHADLGTFLDTQITDAIALGKTASTEAEVAWAAQTVEKGLHVFFFYSVVYELHKRQRKNLDEAFGYSGLHTDGTPTNGIAAIAEGRESEFGVNILTPTFESFIDARWAMAEGTAGNDEELAGSELYEAAFDEIDRQYMRTLAYYAIHEIDVLDEDPDVKLIEARVIWEAVAPYAEHVDATTADAIMANLYPSGVPSTSDEGYFWTGLEDVDDGTTVIDANTLRSDMGTIVATLEE